MINAWQPLPCSLGSLSLGERDRGHRPAHGPAWTASQPGSRSPHVGRAFRRCSPGAPSRWELLTPPPPRKAG